MDFYMASNEKWALGLFSKFTSSRVDLTQNWETMAL
jgi:hypothetical protein